MFDQLFHIGYENWVFVSYYQDEEKLWKVYLSVNVHQYELKQKYSIFSLKRYIKKLQDEPELRTKFVKKYDPEFLNLMTLKEKNKRDLIKIVDKLFHKIQKQEGVK